MVWKHDHSQGHNSSRWIMPSLVVFEKSLMSAQIRLSTGVDACLIVLMLRILWVWEKEFFLQKYCLLDNTVCALCRQQADIELASLNWCNYVIFSQLCYYYIVICYQYLVNKALCVSPPTYYVGRPNKCKGRHKMPKQKHTLNATQEVWCNNYWAEVVACSSMGDDHWYIIFYEISLMAKILQSFISVSYTHLTLPTNREV